MKKRRANGEGTIRQRSNGLWEISILDGYKPNGKRNMKSFYGKSQKEARKKMLAYMDSKAKGIDVESNYFFPEWADIWFENHKTNIAIETQENYKYTLRILKETFQRKLICPLDFIIFSLKSRAQVSICLLVKAEENPTLQAIKARKSLGFQRKPRLLVEISGIEPLTS